MTSRGAPRSPRLLRSLGLGLALVAFSAFSAFSAPALSAPPGKGHAPKKAGKGKAPKVVLVTTTREVPAPAPAAAPVTLNLPVKRVTLENGLRVVVDVDPTSPTVAIAVVYDVGSRDEERGQRGFAHLFEHLMFQGSQNVAKGDHVRLVAGHGGMLDGTTGVDRTSYFEKLPESELALGLWLEADRMRSLDVSAESFGSQRKVVEEEYRLRVSSAAYESSGIRLEELVYQGFWPYEHPTIGSLADLDGAELPWVKAFHDHHYGPNDAVLAIAGDVDPEQAIALAHRYFDAIPRIEAAPYHEVPLPEQTSQRTAIVKDDRARTPGVLYGWAIPPARSPEHYALTMAGVLLGDGESSRLHQLLVREKGLAQRVSAGAEGRRGPDLFRVEAVLADGAKTADVERLVEGEIKALATRGPSDAEMEKARRQVEAGLVLGLQTNAARARKLGEYELCYGDAGLLAGELPRYLAVTKDEVKRAVTQHLGPTRRTLVETVPADRADAVEKPVVKRAAAAAPARVAPPAPKKAHGKHKKKP